MMGFGAGLPAITSWQILQERPREQLDQFRDQHLVQREIEYFRDNAGKFSEPEEFLKDRRLLEFALTAFGLEEEIQYPARIQKIMTEPLDDEDSLVNRLNDPRFREIARAFQFDERGTARLRDSEFMDRLVDRYTVNRFEISAGETNPAVRQAAYFARNIGGVESVDQIMADRVLTSVVIGALQLPPEIQRLDYEQQVRIIESRLNIDKFTESRISRQDERRLEDASGVLSELETGADLARKARETTGQISDRIDGILGAYADYEVATDPAGEFADDIAVQKAAMPDLVRAEGMVRSAFESMLTMGSQASSLRDTLADARNGDLTQDEFEDLQLQFSDTVRDLRARFESASVSNADGTGSVSLLDGSVGTIELELDADGRTVTLEGQDLRAIIDGFEDLDQQFQAVAAPGDPEIDDLRDQAIALREDFGDENAIFRDQQEAYDAALNDEDLAFRTRLDTASLVTAESTTGEARRRVDQIIEDVGAIRSLVAEASSDDFDGDRSQLDADIQNRVTELRDRIASSSADINLLSQDGGDETAAFRLIEGVGGDPDESIAARRFDADGDVADPLADGSVATSADAADFLTLIDETVIGRIDTMAGQIDADTVMFERALERFDPRRDADESLRALAESGGDLLRGATVDDTNLFEAGQRDLRIDLGAFGTDVRIGAHGGYSDMVMNRIIDMYNDRGEMTLDDLGTELGEVRFDNERTRFSLSQDLNEAQYQQNRVQGRVDELEAQKEAEEDPDNPYSVNAATEQFIERFLILNGGVGGGGPGGDGYLLSLFPGSAGQPGGAQGQAGPQGLNGQAGNLVNLLG